MEALKQQTVKTPKFTLDGHSFIAKCVKCYDADTIHVVFLFNGRYNRFTCRLLGLDTAEIRTKDPEEKQFALKARDFLRDLVLDQLVLIRCHQFDKYGRLLINLFPYSQAAQDMVEKLDGKAVDDSEQVGGGFSWKESINQTLIEKGYAYQYDGGTKRHYSEWRGD